MEGFRAAVSDQINTFDHLVVIQMFAVQLSVRERQLIQMHFKSSATELSVFRRKAKARMCWMQMRAMTTGVS